MSSGAGTVRRPRAAWRAEPRPPVEVCVWCGHRIGAGGIRRRGRVICPDCGAGTTEPWPTPEQLADAYGDWYWPESEKRFSLIGDALLRRSRASIARRIDEIAPPGPVLDVGAGEGTLIDALKRRGREATGLERSSARADIRNQSPAEVEGEWAAVVFWHSLEHLPEPGEAIRQAARLLAADGVVVVAVPNTGSLQARAFGDRWLHLDLPRHLVHLSTPALTTGLAGNGFAIERVSQIRAGQIVIGWLDGLVGSLSANMRLYQALRRAPARSAPMTFGSRVASVLAGVALFPVALACSAVEVALKRSGTVYVEARHA